MAENTTKETGKAASYEDTMEHLQSLIRARVPIIWVVTHEESRFIDEFTSRVANNCKRKTFIWSGWQGLVKPSEYEKAQRADGQLAESWVPATALKKIAEMAPDAEAPGFAFIMRDFHAVLQESIIRQLRDMYKFLSESGKSLIITSPVLGYGPDGQKSGLPPSMEKQVVVLNYALPTREQIETHVRDLIGHIKNAKKDNNKLKLDYTDEEYLHVTRALQGLTITEVENSVATCLAHLKCLDPERLMQDKRQIVRKNQILEFIETHMEVKDIGGLDNAKNYMVRYEKAHSKEAMEYGVEPLKGVLLTGIPGTGKSAFAKAMGHLWQVPLLRLDVGKVMNGLVGGSEQRMREVIQTAEAMAPCCLWIDEVEKSLSGTGSSNFSDGGTLSRVFGTLLTAMQEGLSGVTVIATANDISKLPPEFIRRFNEVFFVDLPGPDERWEILAIHLTKRDRDISKFNGAKKEILDASENYTGAEIEKAVKDAITKAFHSGDKDMKVNHLLESLSETKPIHKVYAEKIAAMQEWAASHARYASSYSEQKLKNKKEKKKEKELKLDESLSDLPETRIEKKNKAAAQPQEGGRMADIGE